MAVTFDKFFKRTSPPCHQVFLSMIFLNDFLRFRALRIFNRPVSGAKALSVLERKIDRKIEKNIFCGAFSCLSSFRNRQFPSKAQLQKHSAPAQKRRLNWLNLKSLKTFPTKRILERHPPEDFLWKTGVSVISTGRKRPYGRSGQAAVQIYLL